MVTKPTGRPNGRPSSYDPELADEICEAIVSGVALHIICKTEGYPSAQTIYTWLAKYPEFLDKYAQARELQQDIEADRIIEIADQATDPQKARNQIDARKWRAAKLAPRKYGDRVDMNLTATIERVPQEQVDARIVELLGKAGTALLAARERAQEIEEQTIDLQPVHETE
jgi:hypothetical protein